MSISNNYASERLHEGCLLDMTISPTQIKDDIFDEIESAHEEGLIVAIHACNAEYQSVFHDMYSNFIDLKRISKSEMKAILEKYANISLGKEINPDMECACGSIDGVDCICE